MPRLSVLMPVFNSERLVKRAITTTLRALPRDSELVALNDGSTDHTLRVLSSIDDSRLRVMTQENMGVAAGLSRLLAETSSEYIARMDADDVCLPWRFSRQVRSMEAGADVVFSTVVALRAHRPPIPPRPQRISFAAFRFHLLLENPVAHSTMFARRDVIESIGGYRAVPAEDYDLWLRLAAEGRRLVREALPTLGYRFHGGQVTASNGWRSASWSNESVGGAFADLATVLLGTPERRITAVSIDTSLTSAQRRAVFGQFSARFTDAVSSLPASDRHPLLARLAARGRWLDGRIGEADT